MLVPVQVKPVTRGLSSNSGGVRPNIQYGGVRPNISYTYCRGAIYKDHKICADIPKLGHVCIPIPGGPDGSVGGECCARIWIDWSGLHAKVCCEAPPAIPKVCKGF